MAQVDELLKSAPIFIVKSDDVTNVKHVTLFGFCGYFSISYFVYHAVGATHFCRLTSSDIDRLGLNFCFRFISVVRSSVSLTSWFQSGISVISWYNQFDNVCRIKRHVWSFNSFLANARL